MGKGWADGEIWWDVCVKEKPDSQKEVKRESGDVRKKKESAPD